jgi:peptide/nickel transport system substrate-binding protein
MAGRRALAAGLAVAIAAAGVASGCGSQSNGSAVAAGGEPPPRGAMTVAVPASPHQLDPLLARSPVDRLVSAQIYEPLVQTLSGPYDDVRRLHGLALAIRPAEGGTLWRIRLRPGVRFEDGSPLDASAVVDNVDRWRVTAAGRAILPGLVAADAPRPDLVRLILSRPLGNVARRLASPRLGIVSPRELRDGRIERPGSAGTGPFELRRGGGTGLVLARDTSWWGSRRGLGPALDQVELRVAPSAAERLRLLRRGEVEAAWSLPARAASQLRRDPLLTGTVAPGGSVGLERSVRGVASATPPPNLAGVWLTTIAAG